MIHAMFIHFPMLIDTLPNELNKIPNNAFQTFIIFSFLSLKCTSFTIVP